MTREEAIHKLEYSKTAYQMLIDEKVDSGKLVGKDVKGEWEADTPLDEAYKSMIEALEMGIKAIKALEQEPCGNAIDRAEAIKVASGYCHPANVAKELAKLPSVNLQPCGDAISRKIITAFLSGLISDETERKKALQYINELPPVNPQPCEDAISRKIITAFLSGLISDETERKKALQYINELPPVNHQETVTEFADRCRECGKMRKGHWIYKQYGGYPEQGNYHCSECDKIDNNIPLYCPNCGAKMQEVEE